MIGLSWAAMALARTPEVLLSAPPTTLHPLYPWTREDHFVHELVHERLFEADGKGDYTSEVVEKWRAEGAVVELHLARRKWHDGRPFVAADVCTTLERVRAADRPTAFTALGNAAVVSCVAGDDDNLVRITLTQPNPDPRRWLSLPLVPAHDPDWTGAGPQSSLEPLGLGRYRVERVEEGWLLKRALKDAPYKKLLLRLVPAPARALAEGEGLGAPFVDPEELATARNVAGVSLLIEPAQEVWALVLNPTRGPLTDPAVRDALDRSLDREALAEAWLGRDGELPTQPWTLASGPFVARSSRATSNLPVVERDLELAKEALTSAGLTPSPDGWAWNGAPWTLKVAVPLGLGPEPPAVQRALAEQLGVRVEVVPLTAEQWWFSLQAGGHSAVTDMALVPVPSADPGSVLHTRTARGEHSTAGIYNPFGFSDPTLDALLDGTLDEDAANSLHTRLADLDPALFLFSLDGRSAWRTDTRP